MPKSAIYSWRLEPDLKVALEEAARREDQSLAELLDQISRAWLSQPRFDDEEEQQRLHAAAAQHIGSLAGGDPDRSSKVRETVRARLARLREQAS